MALKNTWTNKPISKSRFVVQNHTEREKEFLIHSYNKVRQHSVIIIVAIAAIFGFRLWSQDISPAYLKAGASFMREVYVMAPE